MTPSMHVGAITASYAGHADKDAIVHDLYRAYQLGVDFGLEERAELRAQIARLTVSLRMAARNDKSRYVHHERRAFDDAPPSVAGGTIWLTPREIARRALHEPALATPDDIVEPDAA